MPATPKDVGSGRAEVNVGEAIAGLTEGSEYHFRVVASNEIGTTYGAEERFTTPYLPDADTEEANEVTANEAILMGTVDPNGEPTSYKFQYGTTTAYGNAVPAVAEETETGDQPVEAEEGDRVPAARNHLPLPSRRNQRCGGGCRPRPDPDHQREDRRPRRRKHSRAQAEATGDPVPDDFVNIHWSGDTPRFATEAGMEMVRGSGAKMLRIGVGRRDTTLDWIFRRAAQKGITILPGLGGGKMENENSKGSGRDGAMTSAPSSKRYGSGGEFWQTVDAGLRRPPQYWEIWNEENYGNNGDANGNPNPAAYGDLLEEAANVIH